MKRESAHSRIDRLIMNDLVAKFVLFRLVAEIASTKPAPESWASEFISGLHGDAETYVRRHFSTAKTEEFASSVDEFGMAVMEMIEKRLRP